MTQAGVAFAGAAGRTVVLQPGDALPRALKASARDRAAPAAPS